MLFLNILVSSILFLFFIISFCYRCGVWWIQKDNTKGYWTEVKSETSWQLWRCSAGHRWGWIGMGRGETNVYRLSSLVLNLSSWVVEIFFRDKIFLKHSWYASQNFKWEIYNSLIVIVLIYCTLLWLYIFLYLCAFIFQYMERLILY